MNKRPISIALDHALLARLDAECREQERSRSYLAAEALRLWLHRVGERPLGERQQGNEATRQRVGETSSPVATR